MNLYLVKIFSFFIGLFIMLVILSYYKLNENFTIPTKYLEGFHNKEKIIKDDNGNDPNEIDNSILPYKGHKFICINTFEDTDKISQADGRWYDIDSSDTVDFNYNNYFNFKKSISFEDSANKNGAKGANINELTGPSCYNFANNNETYEVKIFTMFITAKINGCNTKNNILFEMTGNTITTDTIIPTYSPSIIHINLIITENLNYSVHLTIGNIIYKGLIEDIDKSYIEDNEYITIGMYYTDDKIGLLINKKIYEYTNVNKYEITLGSTPIIINKNGTINMNLYNFVYYKSLFPFNEYDRLLAYNNYYISGLDYLNKHKNCPVVEKKSPPKIEVSKVDDKIIIPEFKYDEIVDYYTPDILKRIFNY